MRPLKDSGLADRNTRWTNFWCGLSCHLDFGGAWPSPPCTERLPLRLQACKPVSKIESASHGAVR